MSCNIAIFLLALGASAHVDDYTLEKMVHRAKMEENFERDLDESVMAKGGEAPAPGSKPPKKEVGDYENKAYKNGQMGRNRVWGGYGEAAEIAKKRGFDFDVDSFFRAASPRIIDEDLGRGEKGIYDKGYRRAVPGAPPALTVPQQNPHMQNGFARYASMKMPNTMRGPVQASQLRGPFMASVSAISIPGAATIGLFAGVIAFALFHLRRRSTLTVTQ